jgi:methylenetetrahydrofolate reductase (NADPH)
MNYDNTPLSELERLAYNTQNHLALAILKRLDAEVEQVGTEWLIQQSKELKAHGVPVLHYYTLGKPKVIWNVVKEIV